MKNLKDRRDKLKKDNPQAYLTLIVDNMLYIKESIDPIVWDDTNGVLYVLKLNEDHRDWPRQFTVQTVDYESIFSLEIDATKSDIIGIAKDCGFEEEVIDAFLEKVKINI